MFSCSIAENIAYGADDPAVVTAKQIENAAEAANAATFIRNFPQGFDTVVGEKGVLLSGTFTSVPPKRLRRWHCAVTLSLGFRPRAT